MQPFHLLVVDDDPLVIQTLRSKIESPWRFFASQSAHELPAVRVHAACVDMHLSGNLQKAEGLDVIKCIRERDPHAEIIAMSGDLNRHLMEQCLRFGASRFLAKPLNLEEVRLTLEKIESLLLLQQATTRPQLAAAQWIGSSEVSHQVRKSIAQLRGETGTVLIEGESGTGKEVVAQALHRQEPERPFMCVNMAGLSESLFESEFFGHIRGAFTGADQNRMGLAEAAHGGDLFLDEIEALPLSNQAKLLRFLESGEVRRLGSRDSIHVSVRVIAATNQNLQEMVQKGQFREDLLYRINGKKIRLAPLRERKGDVSALAQHFLSLDQRRSKTISAEALFLLEEHVWLGNVRELKRFCEQLVIHAPLPIIRSEDVRQFMAPQIVSDDGFRFDFGQGLGPLVEAFETKAIQKCLEQTNDVDEAARVLQVSRSNLYKKIKDLKIAWKLL